MARRQWVRRRSEIKAVRAGVESIVRRLKGSEYRAAVAGSSGLFVDLDVASDDLDAVAGLVGVEYVEFEAVKGAGLAEVDEV